MVKNALTRNFNYGLDQRSPLVADMERVEKHAVDGTVSVVYKAVNYAEIQRSHGSAQDWSLNSLKKAGINPAFGIRTGFGTRIEAFGQLAGFESEADIILQDSSVNSSVEPSKTE